jgi:NAD-dependent SIR2 family protein deacetylase
VFICDRPECNGILLPDVTFRADAMPNDFHKHSRADFAACDLLLIVGTALKDNPFALLPGLVGPGVPRVLIHPERIAAYEEEERVIGGVTYLMPPPNHEALLWYNHKGNTRDVYIEGDSERTIGVLEGLIHRAADHPA